MTRNRINDRPRVLVLDEAVPHPPNTGKRIRTLNLLTRLADEFDIELLVHRSGASRESLAALRDRGLTVHVASSGIPAKTGPLFPCRLFFSLFSRVPYSVASHDRLAYRRHLRKLLRQSDFSLIHCEWTPYAAYLLEVDRPWVLAAHNVESRIWSRMAQHETSFLRRRFISLQAERMRRFETRAFSSSRWATAVSSDDARTIRDLGCPRVEIVPNGVDTLAYRPPDGLRSRAGELVFTGSMDWRPNQDAVRWFIDEIHPRLIGEEPYRLTVVGRDPPAWLRERCSKVPQIEITGTVEDVVPYLARASVVIVPLRIGGGSRLKILEAFAMERPVVSSRIGAEGLDVTDGRHLVLADRPDDFARCTLELLRDPVARRRLGARGRRLVEARYDWRIIARRQADLWREAIA